MIYSDCKAVEKEPKAAQMTIFYAGQVVVFNDIPPEKMEEIMALASKGMSQSPNYAHTRNHQGNHTSFASNGPPQPPPIPIARGTFSYFSSLLFSDGQS